MFAATCRCLMRYLFILFFFLYSLSVSAVQPSQELMNLAQKTNEDPDLKIYITEFPFEDYDVSSVPSVGNFYIDNIPDSIKDHLRQGIYWESTIGILVRLFAQPNTVVIDLGAHIGIHTLTMSKKVGPQGLVVAFEPQFKIFRELFYNLRLNGCNNVIALRNAVGESEGPCQMDVRKSENEGGTSIGQGGDATYMVTLDSLNLNNVSLIKMDVESYEIKVLHGARETLIRNKPVVIFEILGNHDLDSCVGEVRAHYDYIMQFFASIGYNVERIWGNDFIAFPNDYFN